jgi:multicomponent Na+:H+ antiporter subunit C
MSLWAYCATAAGLFAIGLYGLLAYSDFIQRLLAANIMVSAVFLYLIVTAASTATPPHPVPQARVLTGIVVAVSVTALALVLVRCLRALPDDAAPRPQDTAGSADG